MRTRSLVPPCLALCALLLFAAPPVRAADRDLASLKGYVDGAAFGDLAGEDSKLVEVHLGPTLLGAIARGDRNDPDASALLSGLKAVSAYIVGLDADPDRTGKAEKLVRAMEQRLLRDGWEHLARVRDKGDRVNVLVLGGDGIVQGLVVLVIDRDEGEVVFANIAGTLDLAKLDRLHEALDIPGLDELGDKNRSAASGGEGPKAKERERRDPRREGETP